MDIFLIIVLFVVVFLASLSSISAIGMALGFWDYRHRLTPKSLVSTMPDGLRTEVVTDGKRYSVRFYLSSDKYFTDSHTYRSERLARCFMHSIVRSRLKAAEIKAREWRPVES